MKVNVQIKQYKEGLFIANCVGLPGCFVQGKSENEAVARLKEAIKLNALSYKKHFEKNPLDDQT